MRRKLLSVVLCGCMMLTMAPFAFAVDATSPEGQAISSGSGSGGSTTKVAKVGNNYYATLTEAVTAADNSTVALLQDTIETVTIPAGKTITLDLNGHKIVNSSAAPGAVVYDTLAYVTITNVAHSLS